MELVKTRMQFYMKNNPKFADKIFRKILTFLQDNKLISVKELEEEYSKRTNKRIDEVNIDPNRPLPMGVRKEIDILNDIIFEYAIKTITTKEFFDQINLVIKREAAKKIIEVSEKSEVTFSDLNTEIQNFCNIMRGETLLAKEEAMGTRVALVRDLISDQLSFIKIAKKYMTIRDFGPVARKIIGKGKGMGRIGGKAAGLLVASKILEKSRDKYPEIGKFRLPESYYIRSDVISDFLHQNQMDEFINLKYADIDTIRRKYPIISKIMSTSKFDSEVEMKLKMMLQKIGEVPLVVRSSSHLEDSVGSAFSGKYLSLFVGNQGSLEKRTQELINAIIQVWASTFAPDPLLYRAERDLLDYKEQMAVLIQTVVGKKIGDYFLPDFAGVAFSRNEYRWSPRIKREDGMLRLVMGLGTRAVDRIGEDYAKLVPLGIPTLNSNVRTDEILKYSQKYVDVINLKEDTFETIKFEDLLREEKNSMKNLSKYISIFEHGNVRHPIGKIFNLDPDSAIITFNNLLGTGKFPKQMSAILKALEEAYKCPVDVEFAYDGEELHILQCRALSSEKDYGNIVIPENVPDSKTIFRADRFVRMGMINEIEYIVLIDPLDYGRIEEYQDLVNVGRAVGLLNRVLPERKFILMGPGRWGSRGDIKLGVRVTYADINNTSMLMEIARKKGNYVPDLSFGTHFFQDLVEANISYLPLYPDEDGVFMNEDLLRNSPNCFAELVPEYKELADYIRVIDVKKLNNGKAAAAYMNGDEDRAVCVFK